MTERYPDPPDTGQAVIYLRISSDRTGEEAGVTRQREDCEDRCRARGWKILDVCTDNDVSANGTKRRPGFEAMLGHIAAGRARVVVAWHLDRLQRSRRDELRLYELCREQDVTVSLVRGPDLEWRTPTGRYLADNLGSLARMEIEIKSDRQKRANEQRAKKGVPSGGRRAFGYTADSRGLVEVEADALRRAAEKVISGGGLWAAMNQLNEEGAATTAGGLWRSSALRRALLNPRYAGRRVHRGVDIGPALWPEVWDEDTAAALRAVLTDPSRRRPGVRARYLLSGLARCAFTGCSLVVYGNPREVSGYWIYACASRRHVAVRGDLVDRYVIETVAARLGRPDGLALFAPPDDRGEVTRLRQREAALDARATGLAEAFAAGDIDRVQLRAGTDRVRAEQVEVRAALGKAVSQPAFRRLLDAGDAAAVVRGWAVEDPGQFRAVLGAMAEVRLHSPGRGARRFRPETVEIAWRE